MLGKGLLPREHTEEEVLHAKDTEQEAAAEALEKDGPAEFAEVEVAVEEAVEDAQPQFARDENKVQGRNPTVDEDIRYGEWATNVDELSIY
jgi:hypothetical protein